MKGCQVLIMIILFYLHGAYLEQSVDVCDDTEPGRSPGTWHLTICRDTPASVTECDNLIGPDGQYWQENMVPV